MSDSVVRVDVVVDPEASREEIMLRVLAAAADELARIMRAAGMDAEWASAVLDNSVPGKRIVLEVGIYPEGIENQLPSEVS